MRLRVQPAKSVPRIASALYGQVTETAGIEQKWSIVAHADRFGLIETEDAYRQRILHGLRCRIGNQGRVTARRNANDAHNVDNVFQAGRIREL